MECLSLWGFQAQAQPGDFGTVELESEKAHTQRGCFPKKSRKMRCACASGGSRWKLHLQSTPGSKVCAWEQRDAGAEPG